MSQSTESNTQDLLAGKQQDAVRRLFHVSPKIRVQKRRVLSKSGSFWLLFNKSYGSKTAGISQMITPVSLSIISLPHMTSGVCLRRFLRLLLSR